MVTNICECCNVEFVSTNKRKYCSNKCKSAHYRLKNSKKVICEECGKIFIAKYHGGGYARFCSIKCSSINMHKRLQTKTMICKECGKEFEFKGSSFAYYCDKCRLTVNKKLYIESNVRTGKTLKGFVGKGGNTKKGKEHQSYKTGVGDYINTRLNYLKKNNKPIECETCGSIKNLEVHHKDEDRANNDEENLILLCKSCHKKIHIIRNEKGQFKAK